MSVCHDGTARELVQGPEWNPQAGPRTCLGLESRLVEEWEELFVSPAVGANRPGDGLPGDDLSILGVAVIVLGHRDREREENTRRSQVDVAFDLDSRSTFPQFVEHAIDVGS